MKQELALDPKRAKKSLKYSIGDGAAYAGMLGLTQDYIAPFALALRASVAQIGLLTSIPNLAMAISQLAAPRLTRRAGSRLHLILTAVFMQAMVWPAMVLIPYFFPGDKVAWLIVLFTTGTIFGSMANPAWGSLMADLVPEWVRGKYFGFRGRIAGLVTLVFFFVGGAVLHLFNDVLLGFAILFAGAGVFRGLSWFFLTRMDEPPPAKSMEKSYSVLGAFREMRSSNLGKFTIYIALVSFATNLSGPFFAVYMLSELKFNYLTYVLVLATAAISNLLFMTFWGSRADRAGNIKIIRITAVLLPVIPVLWLCSRELYILLPVQVLSGFAWAGFNLASTNFIYDAAPQEKRTQTIAVFNATTALAICLGAVAGGYLVPHLPPVLGSTFLALFLLSGLLRAGIAVLLLPHIREVRLVDKMGTLALLLGRLGLPRPGKKAAKGVSWWDEMAVAEGQKEAKNIPKNP